LELIEYELKEEGHQEAVIK